MAIKVGKPNNNQCEICNEEFTQDEVVQVTFIGTTFKLDNVVLVNPEKTYFVHLNCEVNRVAKELT